MHAGAASFASEHASALEPLPHRFVEAPPRHQNRQKPPMPRRGELDEFPSYRAAKQRNGARQNKQQGDRLGHSHQARVEGEIRKACQMTSAARGARTAFSASAAHHPSARCAGETS